jgi:hypothetical protein
MEKIKQQLQKIVTLTPYHLGELITLVDEVENKMSTIKGEQTQQEMMAYLTRIKEQANIIRRARDAYGTNDLVAVMRLEIAQNQLQKLLNNPHT